MKSSLLKYPKKSHRKVITLPPESKKLAELLGIVAGDGGIGNDWQLVISLNSEKDKEYALYIKNLIGNLFDINVLQYKRPNQNTTILVSSSTTLVDFLIEKGAIRGNKISGHIDVPNWIRKNKQYITSFVRGIVDTDGCLYIHKHTVGDKLYKNIGFCFTSYSLNMLLSIAEIFKEFGIQPHVTNRRRRIYLYNEADVVKYLHIFGSSNPRISGIYQQWRDARAV